MSRLFTFNHIIFKYCAYLWHVVFVTNDHLLMQCVALCLERNYRLSAAATGVFSSGHPVNNVIAEHFKMHSKPTIDSYSEGQSQSYVTWALKYLISPANPLFVPFCWHFHAQRASNEDSVSMSWCHIEIAIRYLRYCGHVMVRNHHNQAFYGHQRTAIGPTQPKI